MPRSEHALRRLVTDLAGLHPDDLARVLDDLDGDARSKVDVLLREFEGPPVQSPTPEATTTKLPGSAESAVEPRYDVSRMPPGLASLLESNAETRMTLRALAALRECAAAVYPASAAKKSAWFKRRRTVASAAQP